MPNIGVLGLQGAYAVHSKVLKSIHVHSQIIRYPEDLLSCDALILPGGESTTMTKLIRYIGIRNDILEFAKDHPVLGTCAGLILMANEIGDPRVESLHLFDISVERNAYGRQVDSFIEPINIVIHNSHHRIKGVFIRAPKITSIGKDVRVLAKLEGKPVFIQQGHHIATSFHPELSGSTIVHQYLISMIEEHAIAK